MSPGDKPLVWLKQKVRTPPFSPRARVEAGFLLRVLQRGHRLTMPHSRPMHGIGPRCHELRIVDEGSSWRIVYRIDSDAIVIVEIFAKRTEKTPRAILDLCRQRLREYDDG